MGNSKRSLVIIAIFVFLIAFIISVIRGTSVSRKVRNIKEEEYIMKEAEYTIEKDERLVIDVDTVDVEILPSTDNYVHISYYESESMKYNITHEKEELRIESKVDTNDRISFNIEGKKMVILMPEEFSGDADIGISTGNLNVSNFSNIGKIKVDISTGKVEIKNVSAKLLDLISNTGNMSLVHVNSESDIFAETSTGEIKVENVYSKNRIRCVSSTGNHNISDAVAENIDIKISVGSIEVEKLDANNIELSASTGSISGNVFGKKSNYFIESHTSLGSNNLPEKSYGESRALKVTTSIGSINILFDD